MFARFNAVLTAVALMATMPLAGCDTKSSVAFKGSREIASAKTVRYPALMTSQGGVTAGTTAGGYTVNMTIGSGNSGASAVSGGGYTIRFNGQGRTIDP